MYIKPALLLDYVGYFYRQIMGHVQASLLIILLTRAKSECDHSFSCNGLIHISFFYTIAKIRHL